jgi:hypothetical protein
MSARDALLRYATPFTTGLFVVSTVSGVALFLHVGTSAFREMHEILSMVLIVPFGLHVWRNWRPMLAYFRRAAMPAALALCFGVAGLFAYEGLTGGATGGNPMMALAARIQAAPISTLAPVLGTDETALMHALVAGGVPEAKPSDTVAEIAARTGQDSFDVLRLLTAAPAAAQ